MGQCLCSWCVEARQRARGHVPGWIGDWWLPEPQHPEPPASDLRGLAAYDQARGMSPGGNTPGGEAAAERGERQMLARRAERRAANADARAQAMRAARERAGASCP
jgi:hypothetical protein